MKIATIVRNGTQSLAVQASEGRLIALDDLYHVAQLDNAPSTMIEFLGRDGQEVESLTAALEQVDSSATFGTEGIAWLPPVPRPGKVLGVAMNNTRLNHTAHVDPAGPMFFVKPTSALVGHQEKIEIHKDYGFTFPELELGVIIGNPVKNVTEEDALSCIAGYTVVNDVTSQGLKNGDSIATDITPEKRASPGYESYFSWRRTSEEDNRTVYFTYHARSKGADTFGPMGPWMVTKDEISDPDKLAIRGYADGELFAEDTTSSYSYTVAKIVSWASRYFTLEPGDIITCGTAAKGVPAFPRAHHEIDMSRMTPVIDIEIDGVGRLSNPVTHVTR